jgi:anaerobic magnesium-protoporphyrin IX monomethyl ester cyclase
LSYRTIEAVRQQHPRTAILCGGAHPTACFEEVLHDTAAEVCCLGEGEATIVDLIRHYRGDAKLEQIPGIAFRDQDSVKRTPPRQLIEDLDEIPHPAWDLVDFDKYLGCRKYKGSPSTSIVPSRGCPYDCTYCSNPVWKVSKPWVRTRSPRSIAEEVELLYQRGIREVYMRADEMNPSHDWCVAVFRALAELGHEDLFFQCNLTARVMSDELAEALAQARCWVIHLGIESGSQRVLDGIRKGITPEEVIQTCRILKCHGIRIFGFFMMYQAWEEDDQLQVEMPRDVDTSLSFVWNLRRQKLVDYMRWSFATPYPGSHLHDVAVKYELLKPVAADERRSRTLLDISMQLPGVPEWQMSLSRTKGLALQGLFVLTSEGFFRRRNLASNLRRAARKMRYALSPR